MRTALVSIAIITMSAIQASAALRCYSLHAGKTAFEQEQATMVDTNLFTLQEQTSNAHTKEHIQRLNQARLSDLDSSPIRVTEARPGSKEDVQDMINKMNDNSVAGDQYRYERPDTEIGYCFGRATYAHLEALRRGYGKDQIRKLWIVGEMRSGGVNWRYHVATTVRGSDGQWWVVDNFYGKALTTTEWFSRFNKMSVDGKLQLFVSQPEKFGPFAGKYSRFELGLDADRDLDYYKGYFSDLMKTIQPKDESNLKR